MNRRKRAYAGALCALLLAIEAVPCKAAQLEGVKAEPYRYQVTFHAGGQGRFSQASAGRVQVVRDGKALSQGQYKIEYAPTRMTVSGLKKDDQVTFQANADGMVILDEKENYYVRGIRKSGLDNDVPDVDTPLFPVTRDLEYVVVYGIPGSLVSYTVNYVSEDGTVLAQPDTYWGNLGDRAVVAFRYIEGYEPQSYNQRMELTGNNNSFTFVYRAIPTEAPIPAPTPTPAPTTPGTTTGGTTTGATTGGTAAPEAPAAGAAGGAAGGAAAPAAGGAAAPEAAPAAGGAAAPEAGGAAAPEAGGAEAPEAGGAEAPEAGGLQQVEEEQVPQGLVDLDSGEEVPLADLSNLSAGLEEESGSRMLYPQIAGGILLIGAAIGTGLYFKKKKAAK